MTSPTLNRLCAVTAGLLVFAGLHACSSNSVSASRSGIRETESEDINVPAVSVDSCNLHTRDELQANEDLLANNTGETLSISPNSMGPARLGMTLGELRQTGLAIGEPQPWISDFDALPVSTGDEILFFVVYGSWETIDDSTPIGHLVTENPSMMTPEGIGPGSTIAQSETIYGPATLGYNIENHSREFVQFENSLWSDYTFEPAVPGSPDSYAGTYDESEGDTYFETNTYRDDAVIGSISIDIRE
ncbi:MAG: hypothetical protein AAF268_16875 [Cyanobacteria bacterium P01_A01_bin.3]